MIEGMLLDLIGYPDSSSSALFLLFPFVYYIIHASLSRIQKRSSHILHNYTVYRAILSIKQRVITSFYPLTPYGNWASDRSFRWRNGESLGVAMEASIRVPQHTAIMWCVPQKEKCWAAAILPQQEENSKVLEYIYIHTIAKRNRKTLTTHCIADRGRARV